MRPNANILVVHCIFSASTPPRLRRSFGVKRIALFSRATRVLADKGFYVRIITLVGRAPVLTAPHS